MREELRGLFREREENIFDSGSQGYWSNLDREDNARLLTALSSMDTRSAIRQLHPELLDVIFSPMRWGGLELLDLSGEEVCADYGCMWGALTIPLAKRCRYVLGVDQTPESLVFLKARLREEKLTNVDLLCSDLKKVGVLRNRFDVAVVNGVLEWIPEEGGIELKSYYGKFSPKKYSSPPRRLQLEFLKSVLEGLTARGKLYLAIENRYDFKMFLGVCDPHANVPFASVLPRALADLESRFILGRPYVNWLYSFEGIKQLLQEAGFSRIDLHMCFPDYRFPERTAPYSRALEDYSLTIAARNSRGARTLKRCLARCAEYLIFRVLGMKSLAPSIIAIAHKPI